ncbi:hypothetical protein Pcinc_013855 [Petrolisthes cinctipes]|uniref:Dynein assembly factor 5, axonemal n=1 Tax=Petrolisthes cinctipes TaxID=88211 RepID=A0AAE1FW51_PETCI|nr:hypothetical protein Pcinc_013855 [Petrolisthes cinctipes]
MATQDDATTLSPELNTILSDLQHQHKAKRRKALEKFESVVFDDDKTLDKDYLTKILEYSKGRLVMCLSDVSEMNRITSASIILKFIQLSVMTEKHLIDIIPVTHHRLATVPIVEESEDARLLFINIIQALTTLFQAKMIPHMNDIVNILKEAVIDPSPEVRKAAAECVSSYARATREKFHMQSESLVKPLLKALHHQRFKNRIACINALGDILLYGDSKVIQDVSGPLARCAMDLPQVRLALVEIGGNLALDMPDRYSYWHRILPILLFGLRDDDVDVRHRAKELWRKVGGKYEEENEDHLKVDIEFDVAVHHYPPSEERPGVGCRMLVQRSLVHILPGLMTDLDDWQAGSRLQSAKLLTTLVLNADKGVTQYTEKILTGLYLAAGDKETNVVRQVLECSSYLGYFVEPATYLPLVLPRLCATGHGERTLSVLSALISSGQTDLLQPHFQEIIKAVYCEEVAFNSQTEHQSSLLQLLEGLLKNCNPSESSYELFNILLFIMSSSAEQENVDSALQILEILAQKTGHTEVKELFSRHTGIILEKSLSSASAWTEHNPHFLMFVGLLELAGEVLGHELKQLMSVLSACVGKKQDPFVALRCLSRLRGLLTREDQPLNSGDELHKWLPVIISDCVGSFLPWSGGRTAETLRTAAVACLASACQVSLSQQQGMAQELKKCLSLIPALLEDEAEDTRLFSCEVIYWTIMNYTQLIEVDIFHTMADKLVKRFDDVDQRVRLRAAHVLSTLFSNVPKNYDPEFNSARLLDLYGDVVIFLDDPDVKLQEAVVVALGKMGSVSPTLLIKILEEGAPKYRNFQYCHQLIESMKELKINMV